MVHIVYGCVAAVCVFPAEYSYRLVERGGKEKKKIVLISFLSVWPRLERLPATHPNEWTVVQIDGMTNTHTHLNKFCLE